MLDNLAPLKEVNPAIHSELASILPDMTERRGIGPQVGDSQRLEFAANLKDAMKQAQQEGKPLICVFEEDNCGWCRKFDQELSKPGAAYLGKDAIFVRVRPSAGGADAALADYLGVKAYPTVSILDFSGTNVSERTRLTGYMTADQLAAHFRSEIAYA